MDKHNARHTFWRRISGTPYLDEAAERFMVAATKMREVVGKERTEETEKEGVNGRANGSKHYSGS